MAERMNEDRQWLLRMAAAEDNAPVSVGGLAVELGRNGSDEAPPLRADETEAS